MEPLISTDPQQIGGFRPLSVLGEGGFGRVYLALSPHGRLVAVKVVDLKFAEDPGFRERFKREINAMRAVGDDYTASVVAAGPGAARPWFAMEYVPGPSLDRIVKETGPLPATTLWWIAARVAEALTSIHAVRLLHRDLKPANILISRHGLRVLDFGISRAIDGTRITSSSIMMGSWGFMPLEQVKDPHRVGAPADVFALGATLTFAGTGHLPYSGTPAHYVWQLISKPPDLSGLSDELTELVTACLARDPAQRPTPGEVLAKAAVHLDRVDSDDVSMLLPGSVMALIDAEESAASSFRKPAIIRPATSAFVRSSPSTGSLAPAQPRKPAPPVAAPPPRRNRSRHPWLVGVSLIVALVAFTAAALALGARQDRLSRPGGLALDAHGDLFIADSGNNRVRKVSTDGKITTVAGTGREGFSGDGGPATQASLTGPGGVAVDAKGDLFIADSGNFRARKVGSDGTITTVAVMKFGDDGSGTPVRKILYRPSGVAVDVKGNLYVTDSMYSTVRKVRSDGTITTVAGIGGGEFSGDGGPAIKAGLWTPTGVAVDARDNLYIVDSHNSRVRKVSADGKITTVAGTGRKGLSGDGGPATKDLLDRPSGVAVDAKGNLYITDSGNQRIRKVTTDGTISTVVGSGLSVHFRMV